MASPIPHSAGGGQGGADVLYVRLVSRILEGVPEGDALGVGRCVLAHRGPSEWIRSEMRSSSFSASQSSCASSSRNTASRADAALFALASTCSQGRLPSLDRGRLAYMLIGCPSRRARPGSRPARVGGERS